MAVAGPGRSCCTASSQISPLLLGGGGPERKEAAGTAGGSAQPGRHCHSVLRANSLPAQPKWWLQSGQADAAVMPAAFLCLGQTLFQQEGAYSTTGTAVGSARLGCHHSVPGGQQLNKSPPARRGLAPSTKQRRLDWADPAMVPAVSLCLGQAPFQQLTQPLALQGGLSSLAAATTWPVLGASS